MWRNSVLQKLRISPTLHFNILHHRAMDFCVCVFLCFILILPVLGAEGKAKTPPAPPQLYHERWRPQFHFSAEVSFTSDPCGLISYAGKWHLFYQYDPVGLKQSAIAYKSWGHAVSDDLIHWDHWPVAIPESAGVAAFTGATVADVYNTTGFSCNGAVPLVAIYAGDRFISDRKADQRLAYSLDGGMTWSFYGTVLSNGQTNFRDPKVFWYEATKRWIMVVAQAQGRIRFHIYTSPNLKTWTHLSEMDPKETIPNWEAECPDLFQLPVEGEETRKWVMHVVTGKGSMPRRSTFYFIGDFNGTHFVPDEPKAKLMDYGADFMAGNTWNNHIDNRRLYIAWMCVWESCDSVPTNPFTGALSMIRELFLERENNKILLVQRPIQEYTQLRVKKLREFRNTNIASIQRNLTKEGVSGRLLEVKMEFRPKKGTGDVGISVMKGSKEETKIGYNHKQSMVYIDRERSGFLSKAMSRKDSAPVVLQDGLLKLWIFVDWSSVELFANRGRQTITSRIYPDEKSVGFDVYVAGDDVDIVTMEIYELQTTWDRYWPGNKSREQKPIKLGSVIQMERRVKHSNSLLSACCINITNIYGLNWYTMIMGISGLTVLLFIWRFNARHRCTGKNIMM